MTNSSSTIYLTKIAHSADTACKLSCHVPIARMSRMTVALRIDSTNVFLAIRRPSGCTVASSVVGVVVVVVVGVCNRSHV